MRKIWKWFSKYGKIGKNRHNYQQLNLAALNGSPISPGSSSPTIGRTESMDIIRVLAINSTSRLSALFKLDTPYLQLRHPGALSHGLVGHARHAWQVKFERVVR